MTCAAVAARLADAARDLYFVSETEAPFEPFSVPPAADLRSNLDAVRKAFPPFGDAPVKIEPPDDFFRNVAFPKPWHDDLQAADVEKFAALLTAIQSEMKEAAVVRVGATAIDVYIVGRTPDGGFAGLKTLVVET
ncbi:MAG: nuclease A inhibitor family protein [Planctomycetia bacterium]